VTGGDAKTALGMAAVGVAFVSAWDVQRRR
jgi:hypothetical protein